MRAQHVDVLKILGGSVLVLGALMIMLPDLIKLVTSLGRIALLILLIVGTTFLIVQVVNYIRKTRTTSSRTSQSAKENEAPDVKEKVDE